MAEGAYHTPVGMAIARSLLDRLYRQSTARTWRVSPERFAHALEASATRALHDREPDDQVLERYLASLHLDDLALACACADGDDGAWEHFVREHRPGLYRAADALEPGGGAREIADSLYAELFGLRESPGGRQSLFRYFHGRSSLATWLRAVLAQRHVDRVRSNRRMDPLPGDESPAALSSPPAPIEPERTRYLTLISRALQHAVEALAPRDRLRLACYHADGMTLAETGRLLGEHEATASRNLARTRRAIRRDVEERLKREDGLGDTEIATCFECVMEDAGPLDVRTVLSSPADARHATADRSS
jgi:RNA polymerase sigma-70 factor, ECF subfamily